MVRCPTRTSITSSRQFWFGFVIIIVIACATMETRAAEEVDLSEPLTCVVRGHNGLLEGAEVHVTFATETEDVANAAKKIHVFEENVYTTDQAGRYELVPPDLQLPNVVVTIHISHADHLPRTLKTIPLAELAKHPRSTHRRPQLRRSHRISGRVLQPNGQPAANARVVASSSYRAYSWKFFDPNDYSAYELLTTDDNGKFTAAIDRTSSLRISLPNHATLLVNRFDAAGNPDPEFQLPAGKRIRGRILGHNEQPIAWAVVTASRHFVHNEFDMPLPYAVSTIANENGDYELPLLATDKYIIRVNSRLQDENAAREWKRRAASTDNGSAYEPRLLTSDAADPIDMIPLESIFLEQELDVVEEQYTVNFSPEQNVPITLQFRFPHGRLPDPNAYRVGVNGVFRQRKWRGRYEVVRPDGTVTLFVPRGLSMAELSVGLSQFQISPDDPLVLGDSIRWRKVINEPVKGIVVHKPALGRLEVDVAWPEGLADSSGVRLRARYEREGYRANRDRKQPIYLYGRSSSITHFEAQGLAGEPIIFEVTRGSGDDLRILHSRRLILRPDETHQQQIELSAP